MTASDIAAFLTAQYDADEKTTSGLQQMVATLNEINDRRLPDTRNGTQIYDAGSWALARVLADIAAKRKILADYAIAAKRFAPFAEVPSTEVTTQAAHDYGHVEALEYVMRHLAAPYADRPGYDPAWVVSE